ncbi:MAG: hypothetical protein IJ710_06050 [Prevotella sp.]|nr:hypothetical protein [Prevotella sp.]
MTIDSKDKVQYGCAVVSLLSGIVLCYINYFQTGDIANGVLGFVICFSYSVLRLVVFGWSCPRGVAPAFWGNPPKIFSFFLKNANDTYTFQYYFVYL